MCKFCDALIGELKCLYNKVSLVILHRRIGGYHRHADYKESSHAGDFKSSLRGYIDDVVVSEIKPPPKIKFTVDSIIPKIPEANKYEYETHHECAHHYINPNHVGDLSKYFKERRKAYELQPSIKTKLEHSVWEHINASIHSAHKGDKRSAKMHADIANSAFKEVAHYISEAEYAEFSKKVTERLQGLNATH